MTKRSFKKLFDEARKHLDYWVAGAEIEFTEELFRVMEEKKVNRSELARRIGTSQAYVTKVLRGNANFTLSTMVKLAQALEMDVKIHLAPPGAFTVWKDDLAYQWDERGVVSARAAATPTTGSAACGGATPDNPDRYKSVPSPRRHANQTRQNVERRDATSPAAA